MANLIAQYKCNDNAANTTVTDSSGNGNNATSVANTSTMSVSGKLNEAFQIDSTVPDYFDPPIATLDRDNIAFAFWFKSSTDSPGTIAFLRDAAGNNLSQISVGNGATGFLTNELITIQTNRGGATDNRLGYETATRSELFDGNWHHVVINCGSSSYQIYIDNSSKSITVGNGSNDGDWGASLTASLVRVGSDNVWNFNLNASLDDFRIYDDALSADEISLLYNSGNGTEHTNFLRQISESDTVYLSDEIDTGIQELDESDTLYLGDSIDVNVSLEKVTDSETLYLSDAITVTIIENINNPVRILHYNPLIVVTNTNPVKLGIITITDPTTPTWVVYELAGVTNAKDVVLNDTNDYFYVACGSGNVAKVEKADPNNFSIINTGETDTFVNTNSLDAFLRTYISTDDSDGEIVVIDEAEIKKINTDLRWIQQIETIVSTRLNTILGKLINTDFRWVAKTTKKINTDLRWLPLNQTYDQVTQNLIVYSDIVLKINGTDLCPLNDVNMKSIRIEHDITREEEVGSVATFTLNRQHDKLDYDNRGNSSQITNNNAVIVEIDGQTEFTGKIAKLRANSETETVQVTAIGTRPSDRRQTVSIPLPSVNENLHLYHCLINDVDIDKPYIDSTDENPAYYKGVQVDLGTQIEQKVLRYSLIGNTTSLATKIENGNFTPKQNWTYFWLAAFTNFITGLTNGTLKYLGTSLGSLSTDSWKLDRCSYKYQKELDDVETDLGNYQVGSAPYLEVSTKNGKKITVDKWVDKKDGLYLVKDAGYDYEQYAKDVADLEYSKLLNINGNVLPATSAQITLSLDGYYYYNVALLTRINVTNTTTSNIYKNTNGFPVAVKTITIDTSTMTVNLTCDNQLSQIELDEIDDTYPDENSDEYVFAEDSRKIHSKFDPNTWGYPA